MATNRDTRKTDERKAAFLVDYATHGNIKEACRRAGIGRQTFYEWKKVDPNFVALVADAEQDAADVLELEAFKRATKGVRHIKPHYYKDQLVGEEVVMTYSDGVLMFLLKGLRPEKYNREVVDPATAANPSFDYKLPEGIATGDDDD